MKTLYESVLDDEKALADNSAQEAMKKLGDVLDIRSLFFENDAFTTIHLTSFLKLGDIKNYCRKNHIRTNYSSNNPNEVESKIVRSMILEVPYLGYEQNILTLLRGFLKKGFSIQLSDKDRWGLGKDHSTYRITKPSGDPADQIDLNIWYKRK